MHVNQSVHVSGCDHFRAGDLAAISTAAQIPAGIFNKEINFCASFFFRQAKGKTLTVKRIRHFHP